MVSMVCSLPNMGKYKNYKSIKDFRVGNKDEKHNRTQGLHPEN